MDWAAAIRDRQVVRFVYDGYERVVQPATLGTSTAGNLTVRGCQIDGGSRAGDLPGWRPFTVVKIGDAELTGDVFDDFAVAGYTRGDSMFMAILAEH